MKFLAHSLLAIFVALWIAVPGVGGEGGENAGGTGVWILPRSSPLGCPPPTMGSSFGFSGFGSDVTLVVSEELGEVVAMATDPASGFNIPLPVDGRNVTLGRDMLQGYISANVTTVRIAIFDDRQNGYSLTLAFDSANERGTLTIQ